MELPVILFGPIGAGKTTIARLLGQRLNVPHYDLDDLRWTYYQEIGYDHQQAIELRRTEGLASQYRYWKPFEIHAVERVLEEHPDSVLSFGAGHSVYDDEVFFERARQALALHPNVILLMPCDNFEEATEILKERLVANFLKEGKEPSSALLEMIGYFVRHPSNRKLAKYIVYTAGKTPDQICEEIISLDNLSG